MVAQASEENPDGNHEDESHAEGVECERMRDPH